MADTGTDISIAAGLLKKGELVGIPTETVYGLAGNALQPDAVSRIFEVKNRPSFDPLIVHIPDHSHLSRYVLHVPPLADRIAREFWPGPLTILLKKRSMIPDLVTSGLDTVGIRCPNHPLTRELLRSIDFPLAAPSANPFGFVSPTTAQHVIDQLGTKIKYVLNGGPCQVGIESTIISIEGSRIIIHRPGGVTIEQLEKITGQIEMAAPGEAINAPGQLKSHYAPAKKMFLVDLEKAISMVDLDRVGILSFKTDYKAPKQIILSERGNLPEAAYRLFGALRQFGKMSVDLILAEPVPNEGLGVAINDRLRRAAEK